MAQTGNPYSCASRQVKRKHLPCGAEDSLEKARISDFAWVKRGKISAAIKSSGYAGLVAAILAAEATCDAIVLREISGSYDGGAPVTGTSGGRQKERTVNRKHTITLSDLGMVGNEDFYDAMESQARDYEGYAFTGSKVWPIDAEQAVTAKNPITDDPEADVVGEVTVVWSSRPLFKSYDFDRATIAKSLAPFLAFTSLTSTTGTATVLGETVTTTAAGAFSITVLFTSQPVGAVLDYSFSPGQTLPEGLLLTAGGILSAPAGVDAGNYVVRVQATNPCGLLGEVAITLVVA